MYDAVRESLELTGDAVRDWDKRLFFFNERDRRLDSVVPWV
jgi:hypothetical protein